MDFTIKSLEDVKKARDLKAQYEKEIELNFRKACSIGTISITKDIIGTIIPNKVKKLIDQINNPIILNAEKAKELAIDEAKKEIAILKNEQKSILAIITSNLRFKKLVTSIELAISGKQEKYVAQVGEKNGSGSFKQILDDESDVEIAKRFLEIKDLMIHQEKLIEFAIETFDETIKDLEYVEDNFYDEFEELEKISKLGFWSHNLADLNEDDVYLLYGNEEDFNFYKNSFIEIKNLYKSYQEIKNSKHSVLEK